MALCNNVTPIFDENSNSKTNKNANDEVIKNDINNIIDNYSNSEDIDKLNIGKAMENAYYNANSRAIYRQKNAPMQREFEIELDNEKKSEVNFNLVGEVDKQEEQLQIIKNQKINYQASSPDEVALVKNAEELNMLLIFRSEKEIKIKNANDVIEEYEVLANFPFSSETKRMGILLRNKKHGHIIFYLKGAESVMEKFVKPDYKIHISESAENLASKGLRTLVFTQKIISQEFYQKWQSEYNEARTCLDNRNERILEVLGKLENNMDLLAVTGVEDLLQDDVCNTIESLRNAGIRFWMLTGDKVETATCISISAGLKSKSDKLFFIRDMAKEPNYVLNELKKIEFTIQQNILIIDGECLEVALNFHEKEFFEIAMKVKKKDFYNISKYISPI